MGSAKARGQAVGTYVALLRGINVGGKNRLPMVELAPVFEAAGGQRVRTYIQSGNVVFEARQAVARRVPGAVAAAIAERFGLTVPVVMRSAREWQEAADGNPFVRAGAAPKT